jgi:hypothetical protein
MLTDRELDQILAGGGRPSSLPTPQTLIEAIMCSVRARGLPALKEGATLERLSRCDASALDAVDQRIAKLIADRRISGEVANVA